jgi:hypothetical protein
MTVFWFRPQNQADFGLSVAPQNQQREDGARHASRSGGLLHLEASHARVSQFDLKTGGGAMVGGARGIIAEDTWSSSQRRMCQYDGLHRTLLPLLCRFLYIRP